MTQPYENRYCPYCLNPVDPETGDHWHYCEYLAVFAKGRANPEQPLTELEMLKRKLENAKHALKRDRKAVRELQAKIKLLEQQIAEKENQSAAK